MVSESSRLTGPVTMTELRCARAVLTKHDSAGKRVAILTLWDDGLLLVKRSDLMYQKIGTLMSEQIDNNSWSDVDDCEEVPYLGVTWKRAPEGIQADSHKYEQVGANCRADGYVSPKETAFR